MQVVRSVESGVRKATPFWSGIGPGADPGARSNAITSAARTFVSPSPSARHIESATASTVRTAVGGSVGPRKMMAGPTLEESHFTC